MVHFKVFSRFLKFYLFLYAALGLWCCARTSSHCRLWGLLFIVGCGPLTVADWRVQEHTPQGTRASVVAAHGLRA